MKTLKKALAIILATMMAFSVLAVSVFAEGEDAENTANEVINFIDVTVVAPIDGEKASGYWVIEDENAEVSFLQWSDYATEEILFTTDAETEAVDKTYAEGGSYVVSLTVKAVDGYEFSSENLAVSVNGYEAEIVEITEDLKEASFTCIFDCNSDEADIDDGAGALTFDQFIEFLKAALLAFVRFVGSIFGYK